VDVEKLKQELLHPEQYCYYQVSFHIFTLSQMELENKNAKKDVQALKT
jgi:hypothetical protein